MTMDNPPAAASGTAVTAATARTPATSATAVTTRAARTRRWCYASMLLAGAAQLITISALTSADPIAATWSALLLATAPAPLAFAAAFVPAPGNRLAVVAALAAIIVGGAGQILHTGLFFLPALVALAGAAVRLWQSGR